MLRTPLLDIEDPSVSRPADPPVMRGLRGLGYTAAAVALVASGATFVMGIDRATQPTPIYKGDDVRFDAVAASITKADAGRAIVLPRGNQPASAPDEVMGINTIRSDGCIDFNLYKMGDRSFVRKLYCPTEKPQPRG